MSKIKIFRGNNTEDVERRANQFLSYPTTKLIDIKPTSDDYGLTIVIIYEYVKYVKEDKSE